ncbi:MAG: alanyl-tRNA synthetase [Acidobacteriota bacterium]|jgi:alanyl-tRNA synthetase|nr:alanyl-tRNA synthetase [Acidobacteriota bacterium]
MMTGNEIREKFLSYFEKHGHKRVASSPLLPANDPTLLFANAGMNQFKDVFLGAERRDYTRAASSQKCLRAGGKHNDLDEVGKTARHHTFFEMLGNFSFGDYFKEDAIRFAWDLLVEEFGLDPRRLWFSIFEGDGEVPADEEAATLWEKVGAPPERILRFGRKDNFWQMGDTGPCGPCSEIHYYMGEDPDDPSKNSPEFVNGPGDTTMEIWNLVFMQFNREGVGEKTADGKYESYRLEPLPKPSVDTGMGLERVTAVLQGVQTNYDTDLVRPIIDFTAQLADRHYEPDTQEGFAMRVIADHARATAFSIADGILPSNEGRNYVLRKIMRRAIYHGRYTLGLEGAFFNEVTNKVIDDMSDAYPELEAHRSFIERMVKLEEERFGNTLTVGLNKLQKLIDKFTTTESLPGTPFSDFKELEGFSFNEEDIDKISAKDLAVLYDTYGLPIDLIYHILNQTTPPLDNTCLNYLFGDVSEGEFKGLIDVELKELQKQSGTSKSEAQGRAKPVYVALSRRRDTKSEFKGYDTTRVDDAKIIALIKGDDEVQSLNEGDEGEAVLNQTPFYAESGGQVGDVGDFVGEHSHAVVADTYSPAQGLIIHKVKVETGSLKVGDTVSAQVDVEKRDATRRNHTATHLMHAALREVLGTHVKQAGSVVAPNYLRFDFSHYQPLTRDEIAEIERLVNFQILRNERVRTDVLTLDEAMRSGAMALFGEKYSEHVRVLTVPGLIEGEAFSKELCGGTHVRATGDIGLFKIASDESIASGTRRIRAVTGKDAFMRFQETEAIVDQISGELRSTRGDIPAAVGRLQDELKKARREADELRLKLALGGGASSAQNGEAAREVAGGVKVLAREASDLDASALRQLSDTLLAQLKSGVVVLGRRAEGKASLIVRTSADLSKRVPAGRVIKELAPIIGGRGGGKPDMAEGGGSEPQKLSEALEASYRIVERLLTEQGAAA